MIPNGERRGGQHEEPPRAARRRVERPVMLTGEPLDEPGEHVRASRAEVEPLFRDSAGKKPTPADGAR